MIKQLGSFKWHFPPTCNKQGKTRGPFDIKTVILLQSDLFGEHPVILSSDLHSHTQKVFELLHEHLLLQHFVMITVGDMASIIPIFGCDGNPTEYYEYIAPKLQEFYFVQGNHDLPNGDEREKKIQNKNISPKTFCMIQNGRVQKTSIGLIGGVNGTMSRKKHNYKLTEYDYLKYLSNVLKKNPRILLTHDTPALPVEVALPQLGPIVKKTTLPKRWRGSEKIFEIVNKFSPNIHIYGHCHHPKYYRFVNKTHYFNVDGRVLILIPKTKNPHDFVQKELQEYFHI